MRIDSFAHGLPLGLRQVVLDRVELNNDLVNWASLRRLYDVEDRLQLMDRLGIDAQVITTPSPPLETLFEADAARDLAEFANEELARLVSQSSGRLLGVATVPLVDPEWAVKEVRRAVTRLGLLGPLVYTHVNGFPLDSARLEPFWQEVEKLGVPVWLHPDRPSSTPDYRGEDESLYGMFLVLGWPYETSVAMLRLVLSGVTVRHPNLNFIVHHGGGMVPFFHRRIETNFQGQRRVVTPQHDSIDLPRELRRFYVDTVLQGATSALRTTIDFFGEDRVLFATDMPFGPKDGLEFARSSIDSVEEFPCSKREAIFEENAVKLLGIDRI